MENHRRRLVLKALAATAVAASTPLGAHAAAPSTAVRWDIPEKDEVVRRILAFSPDMWGRRAESLVNAAWPAMEHIARNGSGVVDHELFDYMMDLRNIQAFGAQFKTTPAGGKVNTYLHDLPGYVHAKALSDETLTQHGWLVMQALHALVA